MMMFFQDFNPRPIKLLFFFVIWYKMGNAPIHLWLNLFLKKLTFMMIYVYSIFIKLPILLLFYFYMNFGFLTMNLIVIIMIIIPFFMYLQKSIKLLFIYSSMYNSLLMLFLLMIDVEIWSFYYGMYIMSFLPLSMLLNNFNLLKNKYNFMFNYYITKNNKYLLCYLLLVYSQMPPIMTFYMKIYLIKSINMNLNYSYYYFMILITLSSLMVTYNYLDYFNIIFFNNSNMKLTFMLMKNKFYFKKNKMLFYLLSNIFFISLFFIIPLM